jgi:hypothetical protein
VSTATNKYAIVTTIATTIKTSTRKFSTATTSEQLFCHPGITIPNKEELRCQYNLFLLLFVISIAVVIQQQQKRNDETKGSY